MNKKTAQKIIKQNRESYNAIAKDFSASRANSWPEFELLKKYIKAGDDILDIGCGNGRLYHHLCRESNSLHYMGVDQSKELVKIAKRKYPNVKFEAVKDIFHLPFKGGDFDVVAGIAFFHHIPSKELRLKLLQEIKRILSPNGIIFLTNWDLRQKKLRKKYHLPFWHFFLSHNRLDAGDFMIDYKSNSKTVKRYYHHFGAREIKRLARQAGFRVIEYKKGINNVLIAS